MLLLLVFCIVTLVIILILFQNDENNDGAQVIYLANYRCFGYSQHSITIDITSNYTQTSNAI